MTERRTNFGREYQIVGVPVRDLAAPAHLLIVLHHTMRLEHRNGERVKPDIALAVLALGRQSRWLSVDGPDLLADANMRWLAILFDKLHIAPAQADQLGLTHAGGQ